MILEKVKSILAEELSIDPAEIKLESTFTEDLGIDSLDLVEMVMQLEEAFDITIDEAEGMKTVQDVVNYIEAKTK